MAKGYLVIDLPKNCRNIKGDKDGCPFGGMVCRVDPLNTRDVMEHVTNGTKPEWCPIKALPEERKSERSEACDPYAMGWNDCLKKITEG